MITPQPLKGFRDFYPEQMAFRNWLYLQFRSVAERFGFQEYEGPIVEPLDLYAAKSGEELVKKQAFTFTDKSGKTVALRPEMTPTLARMVAQKTGSIVFPVKWFSFGPRFRYETPQKGRGREFFQCDVDILGLDNLEADAEVIAVAATIYQRLGLSPAEVRIKINDRQYLQQELLRVGIAEKNVTAVFRAIDKKSKITDAVFDQLLTREGVRPIQIRQVKDILENTDGYKKSEWLTSILSFVQSMGLGDFVEFDPTIVRGLDYYTRTVFEGWDVKGEFRALWGGGRYDNLTQDVGGKQKVPGVGFAIGDMVLEEVLRANGKYPNVTANITQVFVTVFSSELEVSSMKLAGLLRENGINTEISLETTKLDKQLKYADRKGIPYVTIQGPDETSRGVIKLKNMQTKEQVELDLDAVVQKLK